MERMTMSFRRQRNIRPVNSIKHVVDLQGAIPVNTKVTNDLMLAVQDPDPTVAKEINNGCAINSIFLNVQSYVTSTAALANIYMYVWKNPGSNIAIAQVPDGNKVGTSDLRKLVIHQEMNMGEKNTTAIPRTLFKGVIKIPRHMRRFGITDVLRIEMFSPGVTHDFCIQCIFKEYF